MNIVSMAVILTPSIPPIIRAMFTVPNVALQNTMACRVYRLLKLGLIQDDTEPPTLQSNSFRIPYVVKQSRHAIPTEGLGVTTSTTIQNDEHGGKLINMLPMHIVIDREVEVENDISIPV